MELPGKVDKVDKDYQEHLTNQQEGYIIFYVMEFILRVSNKS